MYEMKTRVPYQDVGAEGILTDTGLVKQFQNCCTFHCEDLGYGLPWLAEKHLGWFVISWQIHVHKRPRFGDEVYVQTLPYNLKGPMGNRNFLVLDSDRNVLAEANSIWLLMDLKAQSPYRIPKDMIEAFHQDEPLPISWPPRKIKIPNDREICYSFTVSPMHVDTNGHMNNAYYMDAAASALPADFAADEVYVEYKAQAHLNDEVIVSKIGISDGVQVVLENEEQEPYATILFINNN